MKIVPSVLAVNLSDFLPLIRQSEPFADYAENDLMAGCDSLDNPAFLFEAGVDYALRGKQHLPQGRPTPKYREFMQQVKKTEGVK